MVFFRLDLGLACVLLFLLAIRPVIGLLILEVLVTCLFASGFLLCGLPVVVLDWQLGELILLALGRGHGRANEVQPTVHAAAGCLVRHLVYLL